MIAGRLSAFAVADYRRLWLIGSISSVVRWLDTLAMAVFAYQATGSAFVVAMLTMLRMLPMGILVAATPFAASCNRSASLVTTVQEACRAGRSVTQVRNRSPALGNR